MGLFHSILRSIGLKLFLLLFGVMIIVFVLFTFFTLRGASRDWLNSIEDNASKTGIIVESALRSSMLENSKEDVQNILKNMVMGRNFSSIRIYDKEGVIIFSTEEDEIHQTVDMESEKCLICHKSNEPLKSVPKGERTRLYRREDGSLLLGHIHPILNAPQCYLADCHAHDSDKHVLGVLDIIMPVGFVEDSQRQSEMDTIFLTMVLILLSGGLTAIFIYRFVRKPVGVLVDGIRKVSDGDLETRIDIKSKDELGVLGKAFNSMSESLLAAQKEKEKWEMELEKRIEEKTSELNQTQQQMIHLEKMASMGKLAATVAHEVNNPLAGVLVYTKLVSRYLEDLPDDIQDKEEIKRYLGVMHDETERCGKIVRNLLSFARGTGGAPLQQHFYPILERSLQITNHHFELGNIKVEVHQDAEDDIFCRADQINQALIALFVNAVEAMPDGGKLNISCKNSDDTLTVLIADTGVGIPADTLNQIFEPFVSTKGSGKGVGLGLAVVYGIIHRHGGKIKVDSEVGKGTTFKLELRRFAPKSKQPQEDQEKL